MKGPSRVGVQPGKYPEPLIRGAVRDDPGPAPRPPGVGDRGGGRRKGKSGPCPRTPSREGMLVRTWGCPGGISGGYRSTPALEPARCCPELGLGSEVKTSEAPAPCRAPAPSCLFPAGPGEQLQSLGPQGWASLCTDPGPPPPAGNMRSSAPSPSSSPAPPEGGRCSTSLVLHRLGPCKARGEQSRGSPRGRAPPAAPVPGG